MLNELNEPAIAHIAVAEGPHPGGFEVLDEASDAQYTALGLNCEQFVPSEIGSLFEGGLKGFASAAPRVAARYARAAAAAVFLPLRLEAAVAKRGLGGLPTSLSPFGVTDASPAPPASMLTARYSLGADTINGNLYAVGGFDDVALATLESYDAGSNTWTTKASMPTARQALGAAAINGTLYAVGGRGNASAAVATLEAYDPGTNTWTTKAPMPAARQSLAATAINGILYAVGGADGAGGPALATLEAYDPGTNTWATKAPMPTARHSMAVVAFNGILYAIGGVSTSANDVTVPTRDHRGSV